MLADPSTEQAAREHAHGQRAHPAQDGPIALKHVLHILLERWGVSVADAALLLGSVPEKTVYRWRSKPSQAKVDYDLLERLSYILGIYKALTILIPDQAARDDWMTRPNDTRLCRGRSPIETLRASGARIQDLYRFREYLDGARGW